MKIAIVICLGLLALASPAAADSPVAVVEEIKGKVTGAEFMDYVTPRSVIKIADGGSVVLSYLNSCRRETISGAGTVVVGTDAEHRRSGRPQGGEDQLRSQPGERDHARTPAASPPPCCAASTRQSRFPAGAAAHALRRLAVGRGQRARHADRAAPRPCRRAAPDCAGRHPAQGQGSSTSPARTSHWSPAASTPPRSNRRKSCSGSMRRPSPARRRSSAGCCGCE